MDPEQKHNKTLQEKITSIMDRTNQSIFDELEVTSETLLNCKKAIIFSYLNSDLFRTNKKTLNTGEINTRRKCGRQKKQRNRNRSWEKDVKDWMGASVWRSGRTTEDRLMLRRSIKAATSGN